MAENYTLREFKAKFEGLKFADPDVRTQCDAGWFDWFCNDTSLANKTKFLGKKVIQLMESPKIDIDKMYVFFKNNCPMNGPLYDSFSICEMKSGDVLYWITPRSGHTGEAEVYDIKNNSKELAASGTWKDIKNYFLQE